MLGKRLKRARRRAKMSQVDLAVAAGLNRRIIGDLETGRVRMPAYDRLVKLARALGVEPDDLVHVSRRRNGNARRNPDRR